MEAQRDLFESDKEFVDAALLLLNRSDNDCLDTKQGRRIVWQDFVFKIIIDSMANVLCCYLVAAVRQSRVRQSCPALMALFIEREEEEEEASKEEEHKLR